MNLRAFIRLCDALRVTWANAGVLRIWYCSNFRLRKIRSVETPAALCRSVNMVRKLEAEAGRLERPHVTLRHW